jgi:hypothetical protein
MMVQISYTVARDGGSLLRSPRKDVLTALGRVGRPIETPKRKGKLSKHLL